MKKKYMSLYDIRFSCRFSLDFLNEYFNPTNISVGEQASIVKTPRVLHHGRNHTNDHLTISAFI